MLRLIFLNKDIGGESGNLRKRKEASTEFQKLVKSGKNFTSLKNVLFVDRLEENFDFLVFRFLNFKLELNGFIT